MANKDIGRVTALPHDAVRPPQAVTTRIDGAPFGWEVCGVFSPGRGDAPLYNAAHDKLHPVVGDAGHIVTPLPDGFAAAARDAIRIFLSEWGISSDLESYHRHVDDARHGEIISRSRELKMRELCMDGNALCEELNGRFGIKLNPNIPDLGPDLGNVIVRINRPNSTDFNPPHRDGALSIWRNTVNLWIPIAGCDAQTSLPVAAGSHLWRECDCLQTVAGGASINGNSYKVPALIEYRGADVNMHRPAVRFGEALLFTPYLLHGAAVNQSSHSRVSLELRLLVEEQNYPPF